MSIFDCINTRYQAKKKDQDTLNVLNSTCDRCHQNSLMSTEPICSLDYRKNSCIITHQALCRAGLK